jgi:hypothetical protein
MNIKLMVGFLLMGSGIWGAQKDPQVSQALQQEIKQNRANMSAGLQMLKVHNVVLNEYKIKKDAGDSVRKNQALEDSKGVANQRGVSCQYVFVNDDKCHYCHQGEWLDMGELNGRVLSNETIIFNILPSLNDQSAAGREIAKSCAKIKALSNCRAKILINTDMCTAVETALKSFFDESSWVKVPVSTLVPAKKDTYSTQAKLIFGGSIAALVAFLCYLKWGR